MKSCFDHVMAWKIYMFCLEVKKVWSHATGWMNYSTPRYVASVFLCSFVLVSFSKPKLILFFTQAFDRIREDNPNQLTKVVAIAGDITLPDLGISKTDMDILIQDVSIVFHSAATVKFDEPMRTSINFNTLGTRYILDVCLKMKKLMVSIYTQVGSHKWRVFINEGSSYFLPLSYLFHLSSFTTIWRLWFTSLQPIPIVTFKRWRSNSILLLHRRRRS